MWGHIGGFGRSQGPAIAQKRRRFICDQTQEMRRLPSKHENCVPKYNSINSSIRRVMWPKKLLLGACARHYQAQMSFRRADGGAYEVILQMVWPGNINSGIHARANRDLSRKHRPDII